MAEEFFKWKEEYATGFTTIDEQHHKLISLINQFYIAFMGHQQKAVVKDILAEMADYTRYHFTTEEKLFTLYGFPGEKDHLAEHRSFVAKVSEFAVEYDRNPSALTFKVMTFLQKWVQEHIMGVDQKYVSWLKEKGYGG